MSRAVQVSVAIDDRFLDRSDAVKNELQVRGMSIEQDLQAVGVLIGSVDAARLDELRGVAGVRDVELVGEMSISSEDHT